MPYNFPVYLAVWIGVFQERIQYTSRPLQVKPYY